MNFFESQESAKRNTGRLYLLFALAVISLIIITNVLFLVVLGFASSEMTSMAAAESFSINWDMFLVISFAVTAVVLVGSLYKINSLSAGGARVAEMLDGKLLQAGSDDFKERQVLNVVEEMAIASGTAVPAVYLLEEEGINAFAAGYNPDDAVIGISRGAVNTLSRDQLQGVIAHEFSHILHGDMRINIRLIGVLYGILILGIVGRHLLYTQRFSRSSKGNGGQVAIGLGLLAIGYVGVFFGNLIKAAVSRQREYLADASAVQFTRNPEGIGGALMQIARSSSHSYLKHPASSEISHALFEEASPSFMSGLYATHPPLNERIKAILPRWDGSYDLLKQPAEHAGEPAAEQANEKANEKTKAEKLRTVAILAGAGGGVVAGGMISQIGNPTAANLATAHTMVDGFPALFLNAAREPSGARAVIYYLLLHSEAAIRQAQLDYIEASADSGVHGELARLLSSGLSIARDSRFAIASIAISSLRQLSKPQYLRFKANLEHLVSLDGKVSLFEWALQKIVTKNLDAVVLAQASAGLGRLDLAAATEAAGVVMSIITYCDPQQDMSPSQVFSAGKEALEEKVELIPLGAISIGLLNEAATKLAELKPLQKPKFLKACAAIITADGTIAPIESELLRAVAATIDCPMPPLAL
jgi:Zn-dependent protease with chaperone function